MTPQIGDFGLFIGSDYVSRAIRFGEWLNGSKFTQYTHAVIRVSNDILVEAAPGGARTVSISHYPVGQMTWSSWPLTDEQRAKVSVASYACVGTPYSYLDYVALAAHRLHIPAPHLRAYIESSRHMICSQLVDYTYQQAGVAMFEDNRWPGYVTPADLAEVLTGPLAQS